MKQVYQTDSLILIYKLENRYQILLYDIYHEQYQLSEFPEKITSAEIYQKKVSERVLVIITVMVYQSSMKQLKFYLDTGLLDNTYSVADSIASSRSFSYSWN